MKAILVIDEMPKSCFECRYCGFLESNMKRRCCGLVAHLIYDFDIESGRHECCPLKPMPKRMLHEYEQVDDEYGYVEGWNACLDEMTGGNRMKAILLVEIDDDHKLKDINDLYDRMKGRWCELKPMPDKYTGRKEEYEIGWNDAISEMLGE